MIPHHLHIGHVYKRHENMQREIMELKNSDGYQECSQTTAAADEGSDLTARVKPFGFLPASYDKGEKQSDRSETSNTQTVEVKLAHSTHSESGREVRLRY